jgi:two-component system, NarL family, nitrate/nitrite response regulator NarL
VVAFFAIKGIKMIKKKLLCIVPHSLFGAGLVSLFAGRYEISDQPDILLVDTSMMRKEIVDPVLTNNPNAKLIVIGRKSIPSMGEMTEMITMGARAYVRDTASSEMLCDLIDLVFAGNTVWPAEMLASLRSFEIMKLPMPTPLPYSKVDYLRTLSPREYQLMTYLSEGLSNKVIALRSNIAESTVKVHVKAILRKLRLQNRTQVAVWLMHNTPRSNGHDNAA